MPRYSPVSVQLGSTQALLLYVHYSVLTHYRPPVSPYSTDIFLHTATVLVQFASVSGHSRAVIFNSTVIILLSMSIGFHYYYYFSFYSCQCLRYRFQLLLCDWQNPLYNCHFQLAPAKPLPCIVMSSLS